MAAKRKSKFRQELEGAVLERHCVTRARQEEAIHFARESARMRWFYFDGIHLHYEQGWRLQ